jgi:glutamine cyclotransferase
MRRLTLLVLAALTFGACSSDDGGSADGTTTTPAGPATVDVGDRLEERLDLPGGPDPFAVTDDSVWVKMDDGRVVRIDAETSEVVAEIEVTDVLCQGIGQDPNGFVWSCDDRDLVRIDPETNEVAATVDVDKIPDQLNIASAFDAMWVLTGDGSTLVGVRDDAVLREIDLGVRCTDVAASELDGGLWLSCLSEDAALFVDLSVDEVTHRVDDLPGARAVTASESYGFIGFEDGVAQIDTETGELVGVAVVHLGLGGGLHATDDALWARSGPFLQRVDPATLAVVEEISAPEESGGSVVVAFDSVWASAYDDAVVYRLSPE